VGLKVSCGGINYAQPSVLFKDVLFSSAVNCRLTAVLPVVQLEFAQNVTFVDCSFTGNRGTPIVAISSHFGVSGMLIFVNNTGYEGGALAFYDLLGCLNMRPMYYLSRVGLGKLFPE